MKSQFPNSEFQIISKSQIQRTAPHFPKGISAIVTFPPFLLPYPLPYPPLEGEGNMGEATFLTPPLSRGRRCEKIMKKAKKA